IFNSLMSTPDYSLNQQRLQEDRRKQGEKFLVVLLAGLKEQDKESDFLSVAASVPATIETLRRDFGISGQRRLVEEFLDDFKARYQFVLDVNEEVKAMATAMLESLGQDSGTASSSLVFPSEVNIVVWEAVKIFNPDKPSQCNDASDWISEKLAKHKSFENKIFINKRTTHIPHDCAKEIEIGDATDAHVILEIELDGKYGVIDTQLKQVTLDSKNRLDLSKEFVSQYIYSQEEYYEMVPAFPTSIAGLERITAVDDQAFDVSYLPQSRRKASPSIKENTNWRRQAAVFFKNLADKISTFRVRGGLSEKKGKGEGWEPFAPQTAAEVKKSRRAVAYNDSRQDFSGVSLEHFVYAQNKLVEGDLPQETVRRLLNKLKIEEGASGQDTYNKIFAKLAQGNYTREIVDIINAGTYNDPRIRDELIEGQNKNPRAQSVYEAVSNSLDALGLEIGQFGKGVKQIISWLEANGEDRVDVFTKTNESLPYQLTLIRDVKGQEYIQIKSVTNKVFQAAAGRDITHGTVIKVTTKAAIPRTEKKLKGKSQNSQQEIIDEIHKRFPFVTAGEVTTQSGDGAPEKVNGFDEKEVIVPPEAKPYSREDSAGKHVQVRITDHTITVVDNGRGMDAAVVSRMFTKKGTKKPAALSSEGVKKEFAKIKVVQDTSLAHRVSFARNSEVIRAIDISEDIVDGATAEGGLMIELGALLEVPESRDNVIINPNLKKGEKSNFQLAIEHAVSEIVNHPKLTDTDKVKYVNTIILGIEGLILGNDDYAHVVKSIRSNAQAQLKDVVGRLKEAGVILLPHNVQFTKVDLGEDREVVFLNEFLFDWRGALSMKEYGAVIVPNVTLGGSKRLPLILAPFKEEDMREVARFNNKWYERTRKERLPLIETDRFVALPSNLAGTERFRELAEKRSQGLSSKEEKEFKSLLQHINIITAEEVVTSYEVASVKENIRVPPKKDVERKEVERSEGEIDSAAVNSFLTQAPKEAIAEVPQIAAGVVPQDANQKYVLLPNGIVLDVATNKVRLKNVSLLEPLPGGYYRIKSKGNKDHAGVDLGEDAIVYIVEDKVVVQTQVFEPHKEMAISPDKRFVYFRGKDGVVDNIFYDLSNRRFREFSTYHFQGFPKEDGVGDQKRYDLQFSSDGKYISLVLGRENRSGVSWLTVIKLDPADQTGETGIAGRVAGMFAVEAGDEYAANPFSNIIFVHNKSSGGVFVYDMANKGSLSIKPVKHARTDSSGTYTVMITEDDEMIVYHHASKKVISKMGNEPIDWIETRYNNIIGRMDRQIIIYSGGKKYGIDAVSGETTEIFDNYGVTEMFSKKEVKYHQVEENLNMTFLGGYEYSNLDPLQRNDRATAYYDRQFNLVIDKRDPKNPKMIIPDNGEKMAFKGEICYGVGNMLFYTYSQGNLYRQWNTGERGRQPQLQLGAVDGVPANYMVVKASLRTYYECMNPRWDKAKELTYIDSRKYTNVSFDGKYFVFLDPNSGDTVYFNPAQPDIPGVRDAGGLTLLSDERPPDAPEKVVIVQGMDPSDLYLMNTTSGEKKALSGLDALQRFNKNMFIRYEEGGGKKVVTADGKELVTFYKDEEIVVYHNGLIVVKSTVKGDRGEMVERECLFNFEKSLGSVRRQDVNKNEGKYDARDLIFKKIDVSRSGRFSVHLDIDGNLSYCDHDEETDTLITKEIARAGEYQEYLAHKNADAVIIKNNNGTYDLFDLVAGKKRIIDTDHIEIDSSGTYAVAKKKEALGHFLIGQEEEEPHCIYGEIKVASDDKLVYLIVEGPVGTGIMILTKDGKEMKFMEQGVSLERIAEAGFTLPRYWERYDLEAKSLWDMARDGQIETKNIETVLNYDKNFPTQPGPKLILHGRGVIGHRESKARWFVFLDRLNSASLLTNQTEILYRGEFLCTKDSDQRGQYEISTRSGGSWRGALINQTNTFVLLNEGGFWVVNAEGGLRKVTDLVPQGFSCTDVNGGYFVFYNSETGEVKYLDPRAAFSEGAVTHEEAAGQDREKQVKAQGLWDKEVVSRRDEFIDQAQAAYKPFLDSVPEMVKSDVDEAIKRHIDALYREQEVEVKKRYQDALNQGSEAVDLDPPLPFDRFAQRMAVLQKLLPSYVKSAQDEVAQEEPAAQKAFYTSLFNKLFEISVNFDIRLQEKDVNNGLFDAAGHQW
ncbi:MAG: ATP-binding protein, partial [Candidatus Omnitrophota bacterium]